MQWQHAHGGTAADHAEGDAVRRRVFRSDKTLAEGVDKMLHVAKGMHDIRVTDRSLIWNSDLMETLELTNLMPNALATIVAPRRARNPAVPTHTRIIRTAMT